MLVVWFLCAILGIVGEDVQPGYAPFICEWNNHSKSLLALFSFFKCTTMINMRYLVASRSKGWHNTPLRIRKCTACWFLQGSANFVNKRLQFLLYFCLKFLLWKSMLWFFFGTWFLKNSPLLLTRNIVQWSYWTKIFLIVIPPPLR